MNRFKRKILWRRWSFFLILFLVFIYEIIVSDIHSHQKKILGEAGEFLDTLFTEDQVAYLVTKVVDGDTIILHSGQVVRYIGIDTPETADSGKGEECYANEATEKNRELVEGKYVFLVRDVSDRDRYGRLLRYVFVIDDSGQEIFVNEALVAGGYARAASFPPDIRYQKHFSQLEQEAKQERRGMWNVCN